jgi:hypothetical protein
MNYAWKSSELQTALNRKKKHEGKRPLGRPVNRRIILK